MVSNGTLRLLHPMYKIASDWTHESEAAQASRLIITLAQQTGTGKHQESGDSSHDSALFPAYAFAFVFYLLRCVLLDAGHTVKGDTKICSLAVQLIYSHSEMRSGEAEDGDAVAVGREVSRMSGY